MFLPPPFLYSSYALAFCFGCAIGSFLNVVVWRLPLGFSLLHPPSHCPHCSHLIRPWENIPLLSWLFLGGRCSSCSAPISIQYPLGEAATGILYLILWHSLLRRNLSLSVIPGNFYLAGSLLAITRIDCKHRLIPDLLTFSGLLVAFFLSLGLPSSRLALSLPDSPHAGAMIFNGLLTWLSSFDALKQVIANLPALVLAGFDCMLGAGTGALLLIVVAEGGRRLIPAEKINLPKQAELVISAQGIKGWPENEWQAWNETLMRKNDLITLWPGNKSQKSHGSQQKIIAGHQGIFVAGTWRDWQEQESFKLTASSIQIPREVMGYGDVKCLAMIGAFCGADATIYILLAASAAAVMAGALSWISRRQKPGNIPFGPFLAAATFLWMVCGNFFCRIYQLTT